MMDFFKKRAPLSYIITAIIVVVIVLLIWQLFKKKTTALTVNVSDGITPAQAQQAMALAIRLQDDLNGLNPLSHDNSIYEELLQTGNGVFGKTFENYYLLTTRHLTADMNGELWLGTEETILAQQVIARANTLQIV